MASTGPSNSGLPRRSLHFQGFRDKKSEKSLFGDTLGDRNMADINLTTGNSRPPTGRITVKENGKPISDLKLTNNKSDVLTFGLCKRFLGILSHFLSIQLIKEVPLGNIPDVKDVRDGQNHKVFHNHRMFLSLSPGLSSSQKLT